MNIYKKGQTVELGSKERSLFILIDVDFVDEETLVSLFDDEDILYVDDTKDEVGVIWSQENLYSEIYKEKMKEVE